jgi:effector-binding domain-containing protein
MFTTIAAWMHANRLPVGIPLAFYHDEGYTSEHIDTECAFTIPNRAFPTIPTPPEPLVIREVEASAHVATLVMADVQRKVDGLKAAYSALGQWIAQHGYHLSGAPRERYYGTPDTGELTVEIQIPVARTRRA